MLRLTLSLCGLALIGVAVGGCSAAKPGREVATMATPSPSSPAAAQQVTDADASAASPAASTSTGVRQPGTSNQDTHVSGDLFITLANGCLAYRDGTGVLWLKVSLQVNWLGTATFPAVTYSVTSSHGQQATTGEVQKPEPFVVAMAQSPAAAGQTVLLKAAIDSGQEVAESDESNNVAAISVTVPADGPAESTQQAVACKI